MKDVLRILFSIWLGTSLCACPYSSVYKLDAEPSVYVEDALIGNWYTVIKKAASNKEEPMKLTLGRKTDTEYLITFVGKIKELHALDIMSSDSIQGTAFMSIVGQNRFLNICIGSRIYIAELRLTDNKLSLLPLAEHFTAKLVQSNTALRTCVDYHYRMRVHPMIDDDFCLRDMVKE